MKTLLFALSLATITCSVSAQEIKSIPIGSEIPNAGAPLKSTSGKMVSLKEAKTNKGLLVMFSCNTCPYVVKSQQRTQDAIKMARQMGVGMVIVNSNEGQRADADSYEAMKGYAAKQRYTVPYVVDEGSQVANGFGATRTPEVFLFNAEGRLIYKGAMEDNPSDPKSSKELYLKSAMTAMLSGGAIANPETKSIGCGIKRVAQ